jgi:hypothetical protein
MSSCRPPPSTLRRWMVTLREPVSGMPSLVHSSFSHWPPSCRSSGLEHWMVETQEPNAPDGAICATVLLSMNMNSV